MGSSKDMAIVALQSDDPKSLRASWPKIFGHFLPYASEEKNFKKVDGVCLRQVSGGEEAPRVSSLLKQDGLFSYC